MTENELTESQHRLAREKLERIVVGIEAVAHRIPARTTDLQLIKNALQAHASALVMVAKAILVLTQVHSPAAEKPGKSEDENEGNTP